MLAACAALALARPSPSAAAATPFVVVADERPGAPVRHGLDQVARALEARGLTPRRTGALGAFASGHAIVAGHARGDGPAARLLRRHAVDPPTAAESLLVRRLEHEGKSLLLVTGADDRGLMYALLDVADRIAWASGTQAPLEHVRDAREAPDLTERGVSIYTMHRVTFESRFFDRRHWERYFDMLARHRFNSFVLIFGYENAGYFAPAYPYFFDVPGFPDVRVVGFTAEDQRRYAQALSQLVALAHARGLAVTLGLWDHVYRGGVQAGGMDVEPGKPVPGTVSGLTPDNLRGYSQAALTKLLQTFPGVDAVQFRMHGESGLKREEMPEFWRGIYGVMKRQAPRVRFDARAKDFPDSLIDLAVEMGVNFRISTKYWAEQMGLPFHPTHVNQQNQKDRRHGYADLLRYPKRYDMHWQLWSGGTTRVLLWGDPEYARRFAASARLYDGRSYEVNEMLATKMASQPHDTTPFELLHPSRRYYDYEFERYWHFFQLFGRLGYDKATPEEVWHREFERRFGAAGPHLERALHRASGVLPMINAYNFPYNRFPTTRGWAEKQRREDLPEYSKAEPSDTEQFLGMAEAAKLLLSGADSAKIWPQQSSRWFAQAARDVLQEVQAAEASAVGGRSREFDSTVVDLKILAGLAEYHSHRALAGLRFALWELSRDLTALDDAIAREGQAASAWERIVDAAGDTYAPNLRMGLDRSGLTGHWRDELVALRKGVEALEGQRRAFKPVADGPGPVIAHVPTGRLRPGEDLVVSATVSGPREVARVHVGLRVGESFRDVVLESTGRFTYRGRVPAAQLRRDFTYIIHASDVGGRAAAWPPVGERGVAARVRVTDDAEPPRVWHTAVARAPARRPLTLVAQVADASGVKSVRLRYRNVTQYEDYKTLEMRATGATDEYAAVVPGSEVGPRFDFMYFIEATDALGNGRIHPDLYREQPYVVVRLDRDEATGTAQSR
jgi:hypothetical protein